MVRRTEGGLIAAPALNGRWHERLAPRRDETRRDATIRDVTGLVVIVDGLLELSFTRAALNNARNADTQTKAGLAPRYKREGEDRAALGCLKQEHSMMAFDITPNGGKPVCGHRHHSLFLSASANDVS